MVKKQLEEYLDSKVGKQNFKNKLFDTKDGEYMLTLQKSYNDDRFKLDRKFTNDLDKSKLSKIVKLQTQDFQEHYKYKNSEEQTNQLSILQELIPDEKRFIQKSLKYNSSENRNNFLIQRFDPNNKKTQNVIIKKEVQKVAPKIKKTQINKGIDIKKINTLKAEKKLKSIQEKKPQIRIEKVKKIDFKGWKNILLKEDKSFSLFG